jgi:hypothetical protein
MPLNILIVRKLFYELFFDASPPQLIPYESLYFLLVLSLFSKASPKSLCIIKNNYTQKQTTLQLVIYLVTLG